jgi:hypothetical protein
VARPRGVVEELVRHDERRREQKCNQQSSFQGLLL